MKPLNSFVEFCNCRLNIIFSVELSLNKHILNESNCARLEFKEKQGQFILVGISMAKVLSDLQFFSVGMARCINKSGWWKQQKKLVSFLLG